MSSNPDHQALFDRVMRLPDKAACADMDETADWGAEHCKRVTVCMSDACNSGRKECPTPDACELPEREAMSQQERICLVLIYTASAVLMVSIFWHVIAAVLERLP